MYLPARACLDGYYLVGKEYLTGSELFVSMTDFIEDVLANNGNIYGSFLKNIYDPTIEYNDIDIMSDNVNLLEYLLNKYKFLKVTHKKVIGRATYIKLSGLPYKKKIRDRSNHN